MHYVLKEALGRNNVIPVLMIPELEMATPLAIALAAGGLTTTGVSRVMACGKAKLKYGVKKSRSSTCTNEDSVTAINLLV